MATPFQMPRMVFDPDTGRMVPVGQVYAPQPDQPIPMTGAQPMAPVTDEALIPDPLQQLTEPAPNFWQRGLDNIAASGGLQTRLGPHPKFADSFFQNLLVSALNGAARNRQQQTQQFAQVNEAIRNQNLKDREATIARRLKADEERKAEQRKGRETAAANAEWTRRTNITQGFDAEQNRLDREARARNAANRAAGSGDGISGSSSVEDFGFTPSGFDKAVIDLVVSGVRPVTGNRREATILLGKMYSRAAEMFPDWNPAQNRLTYQSAAASHKKLRQMYDSVSAFEGTALGNARRLVQMAYEIPDVGSTWVNKPLREFFAKGAGDPRVNAFKLQFSIVQKEYARILNTANLLGVVTDEARRDMERSFSENSNLGTILNNIEVLDRDAKTRLGSMENQMQIVSDVVQQLSPRNQQNDYLRKVGDLMGSYRSQGVTTLEDFNALMSDENNRYEVLREVGTQGLAEMRARFAGANRKGAR